MKKTILKRFLKQALFVGILFLTGCVASRPNLRVWISGNLKATGDVFPNSEVYYHHIRIGCDKHPYNGCQTFAIRLSNGVMLSSKDFSEAAIRTTILTLIKPEDRVIEIDADKDIRVYSFHGVMFKYQGDRLLRIDIALVRLPKKTYVPEIAKTVTDVFCPLPIPEKQIRRIFGEPHETRNYVIW